MSDPSDTLKQDTKGAGAEPQPIEYMATDGGSTSAVGLGPGDWILGMTPEHSGWDVYNNEARKVDIELVKDWTASLNFLLVFAAIFAAVLTAFIVESKKRLEQDPTSVMVDVMIFYTNNLANGTHTTYQMPSFEPNRSDIVVNCLFFASLSASLLAALASVVALQWVADYDAAITRGGSSPQDRAKRRQFRYAGVVRWKMGEIIAALPILLYCSVILFLIGLIIWLSNTHQAVGAIVTVGTGLAVSFYAIFTMIGIVFVSAPFRTPLTRWLYSLSQLPFFLLYPLTKPLRKHEAEAGSGPESRTNNPKSSELSQSRLQMTVSWLEKRAFAYSIARKRDDLAVNANDDLGKNALVWLANQISISVDSYRRLLLLVGELPGLNKASPSFDPSEAPWYSIFDTLGASFFSSVRYGNITPENMRNIGVLQRCHAIPAVEKLVKPAPEIIYTENPYIEDAWRNYYGTWTSTSEGPNRLFLLLRELPSLSTNKIQETEILVQLAYWRNQRGKKPDPWHRILALEPKLSAKFFDECVALFGRFCRSQSWNDVFALWIAKNRNAYLSIADTMVQVAVKRADLSPQTIILLVQGHESLVTYSQFAESPSGTVLARPLVYGQQVRQRSENGSEVHDLITLLLARSLNPFVKSQGALQARIREVIAMLWLRPSNPIGEDFETLEISDIMHPAMPINWTRQADQIPHILEILGRLARFRAGGFTNVPLWRGYAFNQTNDPHFVETVQSFDCLMASGCTEKDHCLLVDLICQDLELENAPDFEGYFNPDRLRSLSQLKDPCLQTLANCARGQDFMEPINPIADYQSRFRASYSRIFQHLQTKYPASTSSTILESQASLWPAFSESDTFYIEAIAQQDKLVRSKAALVPRSRYLIVPSSESIQVPSALHRLCGWSRASYISPPQRRARAPHFHRRQQLRSDGPCN